MRLTGSCYILIAADIGFTVNLDACDKLLTVATKRINIAPRHRAPKHFEYGAKPLRLTQAIEPIKVGAFKTAPSVDLVIFEFGAISLCYNIPFSTNMEGLLDLSDILYDNIDIQENASTRIEELLHTIKPTVSKPYISGFNEDYLIFEIKPDPLMMGHHQLLNNHKLEVAQILRSEKLPLSEQEINEALSEQISYTPQDSVIVNWNAAFVYDNEADDVRAVLEIANVQLLEMRYLDQQLDKAMDKSYDLLTRRQTSYFGMMFQAFDYDLKQVAQMQADGALLFEGISSSLKLLGEQYLSRIYNMAVRRFHLLDWDKSINKKLSTLESIYQKLEDKIDSSRMQVMELIIVLLILYEIVAPFLPWSK